MDESRTLPPQDCHIAFAVSRSDVEASNFGCINVSGLLVPIATVIAALDGIRERARQDAQWGMSNHPAIPAGVTKPCAFFRIPTAHQARNDCNAAFLCGAGSNAHILLEEVSEAIEATVDNPAHLREELVQVMAVAMKWVEQIDRAAAAAQGAQP